MRKVQKIKYTKEFLGKVQNGDNQATSLLYENAKSVAYISAMNILNNHHDAEDIAEESFIKALEKLDTLKDPSEFTTWISKIAENRAKDYIKKNKPIYVDDSFDYTGDNLEAGVKTSPEKIADSNENIELYRKLILKLSDSQREAILLNRIEGYKFREIAEMLGTSENTIKSRVRQAEKKLTKEAEKLKKQGYTLDGVVPLDFFTIMSKSLGITASNVASFAGVSVVKSVVLKIVASFVAVIVTVSGVVGVNYLYSNNNLNDDFKLSKKDKQYIKTLLAYTVNYPCSNYITMPDSEIVDVLSMYYMVKSCYEEGEDLFPSSDVVYDQGLKVKIAQKDFQKISKNVFGKELSDSAKSDSVDLKDGYYYFGVPGSAHTWYLNIDNVKSNNNKSKITVTYSFNRGLTDEKTTEYVATFAFNNNANYPFRIVDNNEVVIVPVSNSKTVINTTTTLNKQGKVDPFSYNTGIKYKGKTINFEDYTLKVPNNWSYEFNGDNDWTHDNISVINSVVTFYEPKTRKQGGGGILLSIYALDNLNESEGHTRTKLLGSKNGKYYVAQGVTDVESYMPDGKRPTKKWQDIYNSAEKLVNSVLASFKLK